MHTFWAYHAEGGVYGFVKTIRAPKIIPFPSVKEKRKRMKLKERNGILFPAKMKFRSWIVVGPPGAGKSYLVEKIGGWPGEVGIDISMKKWWTVEPLTHRPREIHLAIPFKGYKDALSVYDDKWKTLEDLPEVDFDRIRIPQKKKFILAPNWQARFVFDFILPPTDWLLSTRVNRLSSDDVRLVDMDLTHKLVEWQTHVHWQLACFFQQSGLQIMVRPFSTARPYSFPVLKKIMKKKAGPVRDKIVPSLDWSRVQYIKQWIEEACPAGLAV